MLINLLFSIISIIFVINYEYLRAKALTQIKLADNTDNACHERKKYARFRTILFISYALINLTLIFFCFKFNVKPHLIYGGVSTFGLYIQNRSFPISIKRPKDIGDKPFILYLRGFSYDNYSISFKEAEKGLENSYDFSEVHFISILKQFMPVYAVGMTKELESPIGAERIYLDDKEWKKEVLELMQKAVLIVILLNDSQSCIWEIAKSDQYKEKTVLISNYPGMLLKIRKELNKVYIYPLPIGLKDMTISYYIEKGKTNIIDYKNNENSYKEATKSIMSQKFGLSRFIYTKRFEKIFSNIFAIFIALFISASFILDICSDKFIFLSIYWWATALLLLTLPVIAAYIYNRIYTKSMVKRLSEQNK